MGLLTQSDITKSDGIKILLENPMAQVVRFWPDGPSRQILGQNLTTRPIGFSNGKMTSVFDHVKI